MPSGDREHKHGDPDDDLFADMMNLAYIFFLRPMKIKIKIINNG
jgi:hypothetical protein